MVGRIGKSMCMPSFLEADVMAGIFFKSSFYRYRKKFRNKFREIVSIQNHTAHKLCHPNSSYESSTDYVGGLSFYSRPAATRAQICSNGAALVAQQFSAAFSPGPDPGDLGSSPTSGFLHGACFSLCLSLSVCLS